MIIMMIMMMMMKPVLNWGCLKASRKNNERQDGGVNISR